MRAVISSTYDDLYFFYLPIVTWSWNKIGVNPIILLPLSTNVEQSRRDLLVFITCEVNDIRYHTNHFKSPAHKEATYAQCARLYAATFTLPIEETLITSDIDMAVFNKDYFNQANNDQINIFGADLVPPKQYPICYISMPVKTWREVMWITPGVSIQQYLDELLGHLECEHFKGNYWAKDQETIYNAINRGSFPAVLHNRAKHPYQFATRRADRDGWPDAPPPEIIDAHLPRPGYTDENFAKILKLFQDVYPEEDFTWMVHYRNEYLKLI